MLMFSKIKRKLIFKSYIFYNIVNKISFKFNRVKVGEDFKSRGRIVINNSGEISLGKNITINSAYWANPIGCGERVFFQVFKTGKIVIGNGTGISNSAFSSRANISVGKNVLIGAGCKIYDNDFHPLRIKDREVGNEEAIICKPISIEDNVFIGAGSLILKGVVIGKNSIIGANSVVTKSIPKNQIWAGNPARYIRDIDI